MTPKVSVIVPVYKAEAYLHRCVDSLLAQTFANFEVLLIDDGSPDNSGVICDEYAKKDSRVRVFHKENGGVSSARQCGIDNALGEYTIHADPDDWVEPTMLEELYAKAKEEEADMVICDYYVDYSHRTIYKKQKPSSLDSETVLKELFQQLHGSCCNKLIRRACYNNYNVEFPDELRCNEDLYVNVALLKNELHVVYYPKAFYHYVQDENENSLVKASKSYSERLKYKELFCEMMKGHKYYGICEQVMVTALLENIFVLGNCSSLEFMRKMYPYRNILFLNKNMPLFKRCVLYLSCIGFYRLMYYLYKLK